MFGRNENINIHVSLDTTSLEVYVKNDTATFSGLTTFNGPILNNNTLTQVGASTFTDAITANGGITGNVNGDITGTFYPDSSGTSSITGIGGEGVLYEARSTFSPYHLFNVNNTSITMMDNTKILNYVPMTTKGITNNTTAITNNSTLLQVGTSTFTGAITANGGITGNITGNVTGNITGDVTGKLIPASGGSITSRDSYDIVYNVNGPNNAGFRSHYFNCNATMVLAINEYSFNSVKPFYCSDQIYCYGITNYTTAITNNSTLTQVGTSTFTGAIAANGGISTNNGLISTNNCIYTPLISGTSGLEYTTTATTGVHNLKIYVK